MCYANAMVIYLNRPMLTISAREMDGYCPLSTRECTMPLLGRTEDSSDNIYFTRTTFVYLDHRMVEAELFPALRHFGIRFYEYNPVSINYHVSDCLEVKDVPLINRECSFFWLLSTYLRLRPF